MHEQGDRERDSEQEPRGWHFRGYLPHFDGGAVTQFVTFGLAGSLPKHVLDQLMWECKKLPEEEGRRDLQRRIHRYLDADPVGLLRSPAAADEVEQALLFFDDVRYKLHAWVVMPNHAHVLVTPFEGQSLGKIVKSWKSNSATRINRILGRSGRLWARDYFDRFIRDQAHFNRVLGYIESNPVRAGLCASAHQWPHGSARFR